MILNFKLLNNALGFRDSMCGFLTAYLFSLQNKIEY